MRPSGKHEDLLSSKLHTKIQFRPQNKHRACTKTSPVLSSGSQPPACLCLNQLKSDHLDQTNFFMLHFYICYLHLVPTSFFFPLLFLTTSLYVLFSATCPVHLDNITFFFSFLIKPTRRTNFSNLFCHEILHVSDSSSVHHQEFIHCTLSNGICHTCL